MSSMEGKKVPQVTFRTRQGDKWVDITTSELFDNKTHSLQLAHHHTYHVTTN